jgi:chemosensory pili system protein ChpE
VGDVLWAALAFAGTAVLFQQRSIQVVLGLAGGCFLLRLAWSALQQSWRGGVPGAAGSAGRGDFATGVFFSLANPFGLAFWSGLGGGMAGTGLVSAEAGQLAVLLFGFMCGAACWCVMAASVVGWGRRLVRPGVIRAVGVLSGLALGYFGLRLLWETVHLVLERPLLSLRPRRLPWLGAAFPGRQSTQAVSP